MPDRLSSELLGFPPEARVPRHPVRVHLTLVRDSEGDDWRPRAEGVRSLVDGGGRLPVDTGRLGAHARADDVEREFRAQLDTVLRAGLQPTHLDFHALADGGRADVLDLATALAAEHGLAVRVWLQPGRAAARARGLPVVDHPFLDSFTLPVEGRADRYATLLRDLPPGLNEWAVHPGGDGGVRRGDHAFLMSDRAREIVANEGIVLIDYRPLRDMWLDRS